GSNSRPARAMDPDPVSARGQNTYGCNRKPDFSPFRTRELAHLLDGTRAGPFNVNNSNDKPVHRLGRTVNEIHCRPAFRRIALQLRILGTHFRSDHNRNEPRLSEVTFNTSLFFVFVAPTAIGVNLKEGDHQRADSTKRGYPCGDIPELGHKLHVPSIAVRLR